LAPAGRHAHGRALAQPGQAASEFGIIGQCRAGADHYRIMGCAEPVRTPARGLAGDPSAVAAVGGDAAIERGRQLQADQRPAPLDAQEEAGVELGRLLGARPAVDANAGGAQHGDPAAGDARIGVLDRHHGAADAGGDQRLRAGRRLAGMGAGLERDVRRGPAHGVARAPEGLGLGMGAPARLGPAAPDHPALAHEHAAHGGIGPGAAEAARGQRQRGPHVAEVVGLRLRRLSRRRC
jgi:hypothetical protein